MSYLFSIVVYIGILGQSLVLVAEELARYEDLASSLATHLSNERLARTQCETLALMQNWQQANRILFECMGIDSGTLSQILSTKGWKIQRNPSPNNTVPISDTDFEFVTFHERNPYLPAGYPNWRVKLQQRSAL